MYTEPAGSRVWLRSRSAGAARQGDPDPPRRRLIKSLRGVGPRRLLQETPASAGAPLLLQWTGGAGTSALGPAAAPQTEACPTGGCVRFHPLAFQPGEELLKAGILSPKTGFVFGKPGSRSVTLRSGHALGLWGGPGKGRSGSCRHPPGGGGLRERGQQGWGSSHGRWEAARLAPTRVPTVRWRSWKAAPPPTPARSPQFPARLFLA